MRRLARSLLAATALAVAPTAARAQLPSLGPLGAEEGSPLQRLGYTPMVEAPEPVARGRLRTDVWIGYSNIFEQDSAQTAILYLDVERLITATTIRYGVADHLEVGVRTTLETDWGGFLDGFMVRFHDFLHLGTRNRRFFPEGAYGETLENPDGTVLLDVPERRLVLTDVRLFAKWGVAGPRAALSVRGVTRVPTRSLTVGSEHTDVGAMVLGRVAWHRWHLHGMGGGATVRRGVDTRDVLRAQTWFGMVGAERTFHEGLSGVMEFTGSTQLLRNFHDHDVSGAPTDVILGVVGRTRGGWRWEAGMQEDWPPRGPSIDFTVQLGLSRTW
jgi:Protein of unknown function (DUF3187)